MFQNRQTVYLVVHWPLQYPLKGNCFKFIVNFIFYAILWNGTYSTCKLRRCFIKSSLVWKRVSHCKAVKRWATSGRTLTHCVVLDALVYKSNKCSKKVSTQLWWVVASTLSNSPETSCCKYIRPCFGSSVMVPIIFYCKADLVRRSFWKWHIYKPYIHS